MNISAYSPQIIIGACVVVLIIMMLIVWGVGRQQQRRRTQMLRQRFGSEYNYTVASYHSIRRAEAALEARLRRVERYPLRPLTPAERNHFLFEWEGIQVRFLEHPRGAVIEADELINSLMHTRGFPGDRFEQRASDLSVTHTRLVDAYRRASKIAERAGKNEASAEELRSGTILYRELFEELVQAPAPAETRAEAA